MQTAHWCLPLHWSRHAMEPTAVSLEQSGVPTSWACRSSTPPPCCKAPPVPPLSSPSLRFLACRRRSAPLTLSLSDEEEELVFQEGAVMLWVEVRCCPRRPCWGRRLGWLCQWG